MHGTDRVDMTEGIIERSLSKSVYVHAQGVVGTKNLFPASFGNSSFSGKHQKFSQTFQDCNSLQIFAMFYA